MNKYNHLNRRRFLQTMGTGTAAALAMKAGGSLLAAEPSPETTSDILPDTTGESL